MELSNCEKKALIKELDIDFEYIEIEYIKSISYLIVFNKEKDEKKTNFVAKVYDIKGSYILTIPFPHVVLFNKKLNLIYSWYWDIKNGIRIVFNTDDRVIDDFWYEFDLIKRCYTNHGKAY